MAALPGVVTFQSCMCELAVIGLLDRDDAGISVVSIYLLNDTLYPRKLMFQVCAFLYGTVTHPGKCM